MVNQVTVATLIQSGKLNNMEPLAWLTGVLERNVLGQTKQHELDTLPPWERTASNSIGTIGTASLNVPLIAAEKPCRDDATLTKDR